MAAALVVAATAVAFSAAAAPRVCTASGTVSDDDDNHDPNFQVLIRGLGNHTFTINNVKSDRGGLYIMVTDLLSGHATINLTST